MSSLATALATRMKERGDDANDLAATFGVTQPTISRWLNGKAVPEPRRADELARYLDMPYEEVAVMLTRSHGEPADLRVARLEAEVATLRAAFLKMAEAAGQHVDLDVPVEPARERQ